MTRDQRAAMATQAAEYEAAGIDWTSKHVAAVLNCAVSTIYNTHWLLKCSRRVGNAGRRWIPSEVRAAQSLESATRNVRPFFQRSTRRTAARRTA